uniref:WAT1-related protein n=1 Tax=Aegilops tauschii subsp. strangulata TaxID=200361 RepID=A0A453DHH9_AEGTS
MGNRAPYAVSFLLRFIYAVMQILTKVAFNQGTSTYVLVFYRHLIGTMFLLPIAFAIERYEDFCSLFTWIWMSSGQFSQRFIFAGKRPRDCHTKSV